MPAGWAFRVSSGCTTSARPLARTCLVTGELWVAQGSQDSKLEIEKGADCSVTGEPGERPPSVQGCRGVSASGEVSDALPSHGATGSSWLGVLGGDSQRTKRVLF